MKKLAVVCALAALGVVGMGRPARAHFELQKPVDALKTNATGDPIGGSQKTTPCGSGTMPSGKATKVTKGGKLHIKVAETIPHGGHYRVAISKDRADFKDPATVVEGGDCKSATIQSTPVAPVVADGLFPHDQADIPSGKLWEDDVTVPDATGAYTVQIIQFMTPHAPGCFYYHCADLQIVDEAVAEGGIEVGAGGDAGTAPPGGGTSSSSSSSGATKTPGDDDDSTTSGDDDDDSSSSRIVPKSQPESSGCNTILGSGSSGSVNLSSAAVLALVAVAAIGSRRRKR